jgi:modification target Cys-rich repeat protein
MKQKLIDWRLAGMIFAAGMTALTIPGCEDDGPLGDLAEQCGLTCPVEGIAEGNFSISGVASIDAFFSSVVTFNAKANLVANNINGELAKIRARLELPATATAAQIKAAIIAKYELDATAGLKVKYQEPRCDVSAKATIEATARCDATVTPGSAKVQCSGSCEVEGSVMAMCSGSAMAKCVGQANGPMLECTGECSGTCELTAAAECNGTCKGSCEGTCSAEVMNAEGQAECNGTCEGECQGTCEMTAKGSCEGQCKGECEYTPPSGSVECEAGATVKCEAAAMGSVECNGKCDGEVTPPMASAECQASAKAEAEVNVECTPPQLALEYEFRANASAEARAEFEGFLTGFVASYGRIVAELKRADVVLNAGADIGAAATGALDGAFEAAADGSLKAKVGVGCAVTELDNVGGVITTASNNLRGSVTAAGSLTAEITGT